MDQLPPIIRPKGEQPIKVPCLCEPPYYDGLEFENFPHRKGFLLVKLSADYAGYVLSPERTRLETEEFSRLAQAWLFFGLLVETFKIKDISINLDDFVENEDQNSYVTTKHLPKYFHQWKEMDSTFSQKERKLQFRKQQMLIMQSMHFRLCQVSGYHLVPDVNPKANESYKIELPLSIEMSIILLEVTLDQVSRRMYGIGSASSNDMHPSTALLKSLRLDGWCPSEVTLVMNGMDDISAFFASQLDRQRTRANHSRCSSTKCLAYNITANYQTHHTTECIKCVMVNISTTELAPLLQVGQVPQACISARGREDHVQVHHLQVRMPF